MANKKRRSNGDGNLRLRADGRWELTFMDGYRADGRKRTISFYSSTQKGVKEKAASYFQARKEGTINGNSPFSVFADHWFAYYQQKISPTTKENYRFTLRILKEHFAMRPIVSIKAFDVEMFLLSLHEEQRSFSYISHCRSMLHQIFFFAEANDLIRKNPLKLVGKMRRSCPVQSRESFTREEVHLLMEHLPNNKIGCSIRLMLGTGIRLQEILSLTTAHITVDGSYLLIRQAVNMVKGTPVVGTPKSRDSYRDVPVPESIREYAIKLRNTESKYIWSGKEDRPCNPSTFRNQFKKALQTVPNVRVLTPHSCRHTYVSQMQALGVDLATIQSIVGHADMDMTKHYLHVQEPIRQDAIARFSKEFSSSNLGSEGPTYEEHKIIPFPTIV